MIVQYSTAELSRIAKGIPIWEAIYLHCCNLILLSTDGPTTVKNCEHRDTALSYARYLENFHIKIFNNFAFLGLNQVVIFTFISQKRFLIHKKGDFETSASEGYYIKTASFDFVGQ